MSVVTGKCSQSRESVQLLETVQPVESGSDASEVDSDQSSAAVHERASKAASQCTRGQVQSKDDESSIMCVKGGPPL
jgi:hypothetical protein